MKIFLVLVQVLVN